VGTKFKFQCECGYEAEVSGGEDIGFSVKVQTMTCEDCRELVDVLVGASFGEVEPDMRKEIGRCPECGGARVRKWSEPHHCPGCGKRMKKGPATILWD
jgi:hypothetical protein